MISHITRGSVNSDQGKSLTVMNTLTAKSGVIGIRAVPGASDQWRGWQLQSEHRDKSCNPFQLCVIRLATRNCFVSFFNVFRVLFYTGMLVQYLPVLVAPARNLGSGYIDGRLAT